MSDDEDWSDSDSEVEQQENGEQPTGVFLGIPDGPLNSAYDDADPTVSRLGGLPPFLRLKDYPNPEVARCKCCKEPMEMLVSVFCPFEGSSNDRVLYIWGCGKATCRRKEGSVRAYRSLRYNEKYARKLERQKERKGAQSSQKPDPVQAKPTSNPFSSVQAALTAGAPGTGLGDILFGRPPGSGTTADGDAWGDEDGEEASASEDSDDESEEEPEPEPVATTSDSEAKSEPSPEWTSQPSYRPFYIATVDEYITPKTLPVSKKTIQEAQAPDDGASGGAPWGKEAYEVMHKIDDVFERFVQRVQEEPTQVLRYDLSGAPLPFSSRDATYKRLFPIPPTPPGTAVPVGGPTSAQARHAYDPSTLPPCPRCGGPRVFECQVMPNLINLLKRTSPTSSNKKQSAEERQEELSSLLQGGQDGMEWGTVMVFSCLGDCCLTPEGKEAREMWAEEVVMVQWDE